MRKLILSFGEFVTKKSSWFVYLFWGCIIFLLLLKVYLITPFGDNEHFLGTYKFFSSDSYDWIANGIFLFKSDAISFRNPGLTILIKLLYSFNLLYVLPLINHCVFGGIIYFTWKIITKVIKDPRLGYVIAIFLFLNYSLQEFSSYILADFYSVFFIVLSVYLFLTKRVKWSLISLGISALFQNFAFFLMPVWIIFIFITERGIKTWGELFNPVATIQFLKSRWPRIFLYTGLALNLNLVWFAFKYVKFGNPLYTGVLQLELLSPNLNSIVFYLVNSYSLFGLIFFVLLVFLVLKFRIYKNNFQVLFLIGGFSVGVIFWWIWYEWNDRRFLLYLLPFLYPLLGYFFKRVYKEMSVVLLTVVAVISLYTTTIPTDGFFTNHMIPITHWDRLVFETDSDAMGQSSIKFPLHYERRDFPLLAIPNPTYARLITRSDFYKYEQDTTYTFYSGLIDTSYFESTEKLCIQEQVDDYILRSVFMIKEDKSLFEVNMDCN